VRGSARALFVALSPLCLWPAVYAAPSVSGEIFKCVAKDGSPLYQNFPCQYDSLGFVPSSGQPGKSSAARADTPAAKPPVLSSSPAPDKVAATVAPAVFSPDPGLPRIGMTSDEVIARFGEPQDILEDEPGDGGRISTWRYADGRTVQSDHKQRVLGVQR